MGLCDADPDHCPPRFIHEAGESAARASIPWPSPARGATGNFRARWASRRPWGSSCRPLSPRIRSRPRRSLLSKRGRIIRSGHGAGREIRCDASGRGTSGKPNTAAPMWNRSTRSGAACVTVLASNGVNCLVIPASALGGGAAVRGSSIPQNTDATARARR